MASSYRVSEHRRNEASCSWTYRTAVNHAARNRDPWWKLKTFSLQRPIHLTNIVQLVSALSRSGPVLDQLENLGANIMVDRSWADSFEQRDEVVHKLFGGNLGKEMLAAIFDAGVCKLQGKSASQSIAEQRKRSDQRAAIWAGESGLAGQTYVQGAQLRVWVLVADTLLERAHGFFRWDSLGPDDVGYLEVQSYVLPVEQGISLAAATRCAHEPGTRGGRSRAVCIQAATGGLIDLLVQSGRR